MQYAPNSFITELVDATETGVPRAWRQAGGYFEPGTNLEIRDGSICFNPDLGGKGSYVVFKPESLEEFIALASPSTPDTQILNYAQKWGLLELCPEGLPRTHDPDFVPASLSHALRLNQTSRCQSGGMCDPERLEWWRYWAAQATALAAIMAALRRGDLANPLHWAVLDAPGPWAVGPAWERALLSMSSQLDYLHGIDNISKQRHRAVDALQQWVELADLRPKLEWGSGHRVKIDLRPASLFGALGLQLVFLCADIDGLAHCAGCHTLLVPGRRPSFRERRVYCEHCRAEGAAKRNASLALYSRRSADPAFRQQEAERQRRRRADKRAADPR
jgi:hypothetical protein